MIDSAGRNLSDDPVWSAGRTSQSRFSCRERSVSSGHGQGHLADGTWLPPELGFIVTSQVNDDNSPGIFSSLRCRATTEGVFAAFSLEEQPRP